MTRVRLTPRQTPFDAEVIVPGSKSYTLRALLLAAMTPGPVQIQNPLRSDDAQAMVDCLNALQISTQWTHEGASDENTINVLGDWTQVRPGDYHLNANLSAATLRFLIALSSLLPGTQTLFGEAGLNKRPVRDLVAALRQLGAEIQYLDRDGYPPVRVTSSVLTPGIVTVSGSISSQYLSALLMIAPLVGDMNVQLDGELISKPYVEMTLSVMRAFGVHVEHQNFQRFHVPAHAQYQAERYLVEPDASSAAYFFAMAALSRSRVKIKHLTAQSVQADLAFVRLLVQMGNEVFYEPDGIRLVGQGVQPVDVDMRNYPDQAQTMAVLAAFADGTSRIAGVRSLRVKETERVAAVETELAKMGIQTMSQLDELTILGGEPQAADIDTYGDHRMAMAFAVAGAALPGMSIRNPEVVSKTFPRFWETVKTLGIGVEGIGVKTMVPVRESEVCER